MTRPLYALLVCALAVALPCTSADASSAPLPSSTQAASQPGTGAQTCTAPAGDAGPGACGVQTEAGGDGADEEASLQKRVEKFTQWLETRGIALGGPSGVPVEVSAGIIGACQAVTSPGCHCCTV